MASTVDRLDMQQWHDALRSCLRGGKYALVAGNAVLIALDVADCFHPVLSLLDPVPEQAVLVLYQLHPAFTRLLDHIGALHGQELQRTTLERVIFVENEAVAPKLDGADVDVDALASLVPHFSSRVVNTDSGVLVAVAQDEDDAKVVLSQVMQDLQALDDSVLERVEGVTVLVEFAGGYVGQTHHTTAVPSIIRIECSPCNLEETSLDSVLEKYEADFRAVQEVFGYEQAEFQLKVAAGFELWQGKASMLDEEEGRPSATLELLSRWSGIENIRALCSKPPPHAQSVAVFRYQSNNSIATDTPMKASDGTESFSEQFLRTSRVLAHLQQKKSTWMSSDSNSDEPRDVATILREVRSILSNTELDVTQQSSGNTVELALDIERELARAHDVPVRTNLDATERLWNYVVSNVGCTDVVVQIMREVVAVATNARTLPLVVDGNPTRVAALFKTRQLAQSEQMSGQNATAFQALQRSLLQPEHALPALIEVGTWKQSRDIEYWLKNLGFSEFEAASMIARMDGVDPQTQHHPAQLMIEAVALASAVGIKDSLLRHLALQAMSPGATPKTCLALALSGFLPDRLQTSLADPFFWDITMSFSDAFRRTARICSGYHHRLCSATAVVPSNRLGAGLSSDVRQIIRRVLQALPAASEELSAAVVEHDADTDDATTRSPAQTYILESSIRKLIY